MSGEPSKKLKKLLGSEDSKEFRVIEREFKVIDTDTVLAVVDSVLAERLRFGKNYLEGTSDDVGTDCQNKTDRVSPARDSGGDIPLELRI